MGAEPSHCQSCGDMFPYMCDYCPYCEHFQDSDGDDEAERLEEHQEEQVRQEELKQKQAREKELKEQEEQGTQEKLKQAQLEKERKEKERKEKEAQKSEARKREEERARKREAELKQRKEETEKEAARVEELRRKEKERLEKLRQLANKNKNVCFDYKIPKWKSGAHQFVVMSLNENTREVFKAAPIERYQSSPLSFDDNGYDEEELLSEDEGSGEDKEETSEMVTRVSFILDDLSPDEELDSEWLLSAQCLMLTYFAQCSGCTSTMETDIYLDFLTCIQSGLSDEDSLSLAKALYSLTTSPVSSCVDESLPIAAKVSSLLLQLQRQNHGSNYLWMQRCLYQSVLAMAHDKQLSEMAMDGASGTLWSTYDWLKFLQNCIAANVSILTLKHIIHLVQVYCMTPVVVKNALWESADGLEIIPTSSVGDASKSEKSIQVSAAIQSGHDDFSEVVTFLSTEEFILKYADAKQPLCTQKYLLHLIQTEDVEDVQDTTGSTAIPSLKPETADDFTTEDSCWFWSADDFLHKFSIGAKSHLCTRKHLLHLIQTNSVRPEVVTSTSQTGAKLLSIMESAIQNEPDKFLVDIMDEIRLTKLIDEATIDRLERIVQAIYDQLDETDININLDYESCLNDGLENMMSSFKQIKGNNDSAIASGIVVLMCAVRKTKPYHPRVTQVVALVILLLSGKDSHSRLLEVLTGEGKSCIIAMFAAVLGIQGKDVDIITSSPILALRDAEEWKEFYHIFGLSAAHNVDVQQSSFEGSRRELCYKNPIVYGTLSNFSADILYEEFEQKRTRGGRRYDAAIVDEVDMLMLDEGVQFTYLSHNVAVLHHMQPVLAGVWAFVGTRQPLSTVGGRVLYAGIQKNFADMIFEFLDPKNSNVEDSSQLLAIARDSDILKQEQLDMLLSENQEESRKGMETIEANDILTFIKALKCYDIPSLPSFELYEANKDDILEALNCEPQGIKILFIDSGFICILNTREELSEEAVKEMKSRLQFSADKRANEERGEDKIGLPNCLKEFVMNQVPVYVENAIRALHMVEDREYAVRKGAIIPVDFLNSGIMELNKKWGGGLQQMLEMKHGLFISSLSLVTNFISNFELFSRYKEGGIYGLSGTLGLDSDATTKVLCDLFDVEVCKIPTHKVKKLSVKPVVIVEDEKEWLMEIMSIIDNAVKEETWKNGRAILVLCEDIKTAEDLKECILRATERREERIQIHLYAHSNSKELDIIKKKLGPGEVVIATNLAGRGTDIKVYDEVNKSGGLLCLLTFFPRNRRVELQAFGRTGRQGKPGSVHCVLKSSSLPLHYQGLDSNAIQRLREEEESLRLDMLINSQLKEVQLKERLFKKHCQFLKEIYYQFESRDDVSVLVDSLNENWGQWLQMKSEQIAMFKDDLLLHDLCQAQVKIKQSIATKCPGFVHLPMANFHHLVKFGNQLLILQDKENAERACSYYTKSIELEPGYGAIAHYNRAYCTIIAAGEMYKEKALDDLKKALKCVEPYTIEASNTLQCVSVVCQLQGITLDKDRNFVSQMEARLHLLGFIRKKIEEAIQEIEKNRDCDIEAFPSGIHSLIPTANYVTNQEIATLWSLGCEVVYTVKKKPKFCWSGLLCFFLGIAQIAVGVALMTFSVGTAASIGTNLIGEGLSDCGMGIKSMITGEFSWTDYAINKATGIAMALASGGIARLASKGTKGLNIGAKFNTLGKELKVMPKVMKNSFGTAAVSNLKNVAVYVAKEVALEVVSYAQNKLFEEIVEKTMKHIGNKCKDRILVKLEEIFLKGRLGHVIDVMFIEKLEKDCLSSSEVSEQLQRDVEDFFSFVGSNVVHKLVSDPGIKKRLSSMCLNLSSQVSSQCPKGGKMELFAGIFKVVIAGAVVTDAINKLDDFTNRFIPEMEIQCIEQLEEEVPLSCKSTSKYSHIEGVKNLKVGLASFTGTYFSEAVSGLLQQNLDSVMSHGLSQTVGKLSRNVLSKHVLKTDRTLEKIRAGQHANYIRSFEAGGSHSQKTIALVESYAKHMSNPENPGSLTELRIATDQFGQGVTIYEDKGNGKLMKSCSIDPSNKTAHTNLELIYVPPLDKQSVGHYDLLVAGKRVTTRSENSNCLFLAYAHAMNPDLPRRTLEERAVAIRQMVVEDLTSQPHKYGGHIKCREEMNHLRYGHHFAMIGGARPPTNKRTKVRRGNYEQNVENQNELCTKYKQLNGVKCKAVETFTEPIDIENGIVSKTARLSHIDVTMEELSFAENANTRCYHTKPIPGIPKLDGGTTPQAAHLVDSQVGANCGPEYANTCMASASYNKEMSNDLWSKPVRDAIGGGKFEERVQCLTCPLFSEKFEDSKYKEKFISDLNKTREEKYQITPEMEANVLARFENLQERVPNIHRIQGIKYTIKLPQALKSDQVTEINQSKTSVKFEISRDKKTIYATKGTDYNVCLPKDCSKLNASGELRLGEIGNATSKVEPKNFNKPPAYRNRRTHNKPN